MAKDSAKLHLGCGLSILPDWINVDCVDMPGVDLVFDLDKCDSHSLPIEDNCIDTFFASHLLEHIAKPLPLMQELYRVAKTDAQLTFFVPYGSSDDAFEDPTHVRAYFLNSFYYFSQPYYWRANYGYSADWQPEQILLKISAENHGGRMAEDIMEDIMTLRNIVIEMGVTLRAVKPARPAKRELQSFAELRFDFV